jgi:hypothetical protein
MIQFKSFSIVEKEAKKGKKIFTTKPHLYKMKRVGKFLTFEAV